MRGFVQLSDLPICVALAVFLSTCLPQPAAAQDYVWSAVNFPRQCLAALWLTGRGLGQLAFGRLNSIYNESI
jgi:hypothetical protein